MVLWMSTNLIQLLEKYSNNRSKYFYNIMPIENIPSVIKNGILSFYNAKGIKHRSVALQTVQERREIVRIPNGRKLHSYANLYFTFHNPMMYKRRNEAETFCVLAIDASVLYFDGCVLSDRNAAAEWVRFFTPEDGLKEINFDAVFADDWTDPNPYNQMSKKAIKCAEILIPDKVPYDYIRGAYVFDKRAENEMISLGFNKKIIIDSKVFYR